MPGSTIQFGPEIFARQTAGGISRYFSELFREFVNCGANFLVHANPEDNALLRGVVPALGERLKTFAEPKGPRLLRAAALELSFAARMRSLGRAGTIVHHTYYPFVSRKVLCPAVTTIHDLCEERVGHGAAAKLRNVLKRRAAARADLIIAVSHATKQDIVNCWGIPEDRIVVVHHGVREFGPTMAAPFISEPFLLFVGKRDGYKNFDVAVHAYRRSGLYKDIALVCIGGGDPSAPERALLGKLGVAGRVIFRSGNDAELLRGYSDAVGLVYPSLFEGFGLPLLEAMISSCPVVCGRHTSLGEVGGDAALYADVTDVDALSFTLQRLAQDGSLRSELVEKGRTRAAQFSWASTAKGHLLAYERFL